MKLAVKIVGMIGLILAGSVWAQGESLPGSVIPEQVGKALRSEQPKPTEILPPLVGPPKTAPTPLGAQAEKVKFQLNGLILEGNHVYSTRQLRPLYQDKIG